MKEINAMNQTKAIERSCCGNSATSAAAEARHSSESWSYMPSIDVVEQGDAYIIEADAPGVMPTDMDITYENGVLHIHGRVAGRMPAEGRFIRQEYGVGDFDRSIPLGRLAEFIDGEHIGATHADGVLKVRLPKLRTAQARRVEVRAG
jgi:HSP20 family protein